MNCRRTQLRDCQRGAHWCDIAPSLPHIIAAAPVECAVDISGNTKRFLATSGPAPRRTCDGRAIRTAQAPSSRRHRGNVADTAMRPRLVASKPPCHGPRCRPHRRFANARCSMPRRRERRESLSRHAAQRRWNLARSSTYSMPRLGVGCSRFPPTTPSLTRCVTAHSSLPYAANSTRRVSTSKHRGGAVFSPVQRRFRQATRASPERAKPLPLHGIITRSQADCNRSIVWQDDSK